MSGKCDRTSGAWRAIALYRLESINVKNITILAMTQDNTLTDQSLTNTIPQPDPNWDYYELWQSLHIAQFKIQAGLKLVLGQEQANHDTDQKLKEILETVVEELEQVIDNDLTGYTDDEVYD